MAPAKICAWEEAVSSQISFTRKEAQKRTLFRSRKSPFQKGAMLIGDRLRHRCRGDTSSQDEG